MVFQGEPGPDGAAGIPGIPGEDGAIGPKVSDLRSKVISFKLVQVQTANEYCFDCKSIQPLTCIELFNISSHLKHKKNLL